ncbi:MAG TPA: crosslink repair DNA glycosylase YcaQ family protein [Usitatibacteraceae bacterium]
MTPDDLRRFAVGRSLHASQDLFTAINRLGYVQADPIRAPARAQDLILRHRVIGYRIDDLEKQYSQLPVREEMLHNYGFVPQDHLNLLYPRRPSPRWQEFMAGHRGLRGKVLRYLADHAEAHPRDVERALGSGARINGWGSSSSATTLMLEGLHREGKTMVLRRDAGIRIYATASALDRDLRLAPGARADGLVRLLINLYAPLPLRSLAQLISMVGHRKPDVDYPARIDRMVKRGEVMRETIDGLVYLWPANESAPAFVDDRVYLLAPFDPVVWDRRRFEHLWGWAYRFEAYTPPAKRKLGYYALPMLWRAQVIGWANVSIDNERLRVETGFAHKLPSGREARAVFKHELAAEIQRLGSFLGVA